MKLNKVAKKIVLVDLFSVLFKIFFVKLFKLLKFTNSLIWKSVEVENSANILTLIILNSGLNQLEDGS